MAPVVDGLAKQYEGKVAVRHIDANAEMDLSNKFGIRAVPTYIFLSSTGKVLETQKGGNPSALQAGFEKAAAQ